MYAHVCTYTSLCVGMQKRVKCRREKEREEKKISVKIMVFGKEKVLNICNSVF